jgi:hypothetical protein
MAGRGSGLVTAIWVIVGLALAASHHYFNHLGGAKLIISAILAVLLWPLLLVGVNLHIH